ncbi:hypothetical protein [Arthrobacter monumenti]
MAKFRTLIPAWFRSAPLLLTMLALMTGIVGMHLWTGSERKPLLKDNHS